MSSPGPSSRRSHLKVTRSTSNLRIPSVATTTGSPLAHNTEALASSASSLNNVDMNDRILVLEPEADVDTVIEQQNAIGKMDASAGDEESKENLRAKLRSTLSKKQSLTGMSQPECGGTFFFRTLCWLNRLVFSARCRDSAEKEREVNGVERVGRNSPFVDFLYLHCGRESSQTGLLVADEYPPRQYFVLTDAGKPVFTTLRDEDSVEVASSIGVMQALISVFLDDHDKIRSINAGSCRITFLLRQPLYYVCVSSWGEPESVVSNLTFVVLYRRCWELKSTKKDAITP